MPTDVDPERADSLRVVQDDVAHPFGPSHRTWRILVVDDDPDVHVATHFSLRKATILGRRLEMLHAHSVEEAMALARSVSGIAVALVDVVMETPDAGLRLVRLLREIGLHEMRIILRTGYPGYAPELEVVNGYEIDDYRTKDEMTHTRMLTVLTASIRSYDQMHAIAKNRAGLRMIVASSTQLFRRSNLELFASGVLTQIAGLLGIEPSGLVCATGVRLSGLEHAKVICGIGRFGDLVGQPVEAIGDEAVKRLLIAARAHPGPIVQDGYLAINFRCEARRELAVVIEAPDELTTANLDLLKLFSTNVTIGFENLALVEELDRLAYLDPILETPNLNAFEAALRARLDGGAMDGRVAFASIDALQPLIAAYGPVAIRGMLRSVYERLVDGRSGDMTVARIGDGTFGLVGERNMIDASIVPSAFAAPFRICDVNISPTATTAIVDLADLAPDPASIMRTAVVALQHAKRTRRGQSMLYEDVKSEVDRRVDLQVALKRAVEHGDGLAVHLQPKVDLATSAVIGAEALLRWTNDGEAVSPAEFVPIAEAVGLTAELTRFVIAAIGDWHRSSGDRTRVPVAINLSMLDLNSQGFATRLFDALAGAGLSPDTVEFEVTEGIAMQNAPWAIDQTRALKEQGFRIALDDFGTGYSSLGQFDRLPIDTLKIDRSFIKRMEMASARHSLAAVVLAMANALDVECVAEGIETEEQKQALVFLGCRIGQGFLFGRPTSIPEFDRQFMARASA